MQPSSQGAPKPILLYSAQDDTGVRGAALEYGVTEIFTGEISRVLAENVLKRLLSEPYFDEAVCKALELCKKARKKGEQGMARSILVDLHNDHKDLPIVSCALAEDYLLTEEVEEALQLVEPLVASDDPLPRALSIKGKCLMKQKKFEDAAKVMAKADVINPNDTDRLLALGRCYLEVFKPERAARYFKRVLDLDPRKQEAQKGLGESLLLNGDINEALAGLKSLSSDSEMASVFNSAAVLAIRNGKFASGVQLYQTAVETLDPKNKPLLAKLGFNTGLAYLRQGTLPKAHYYFTVALALDPSYEKARKNKKHLDDKLGIDHDYLKNMDPDPVKALLEVDSVNLEQSPEGAQIAKGDFDLSF